jgi:arylsulfatase A-like enzyme
MSQTASIIGTGSYAPDRVMTNADLEKLVETSDEWIQTRTGIRERRIAGPEMTTSEMAARASRAAIENAGIKAEEIDRACMALITDLKDRGMLESTIVVWAGEFGRTPMSQGNGRDHHNKAMSVWLAGGGIKGGLVYGASDELGYAAVENVCTVHDLHATMLHQLGIQHDAFSVKFQGLDAKLTGVEGARVLEDILT